MKVVAKPHPTDGTTILAKSWVAARVKQLLGRFNIHMSDAQFNEMILKIDENSDGEITYTEFVRFVSCPAKARRDAQGALRQRRARTRWKMLGLVVVGCLKW